MGDNEITRKIQEVKSQNPDREIKVLLKTGRTCEKSTSIGLKKHVFKEVIDKGNYLMIYFDYEKL